MKRSLLLTILLLLLSASAAFAADTLVVYFSATGNTARVADYIAEATGADTFELTAADPYTRADLNYNNSSSRVVYEHEHPEVRPEIAVYPELSEYDVIYLGYPLWWRAAPNIIHTFLENTDLSGKTIVPFCTSISTGDGRNAEELHSLQPAATWIDGQRFQSRATRNTVTSWVSEVESSIR